MTGRQFLNTMRPVFFLTVLLFLSQSGSFLYSQDQDVYYNKNFIRNEDYIYKKNIKTVLLYKRGFELSPPIIVLLSDEKLVLSFDDLDADVKKYRYSVQHCDAFWKPSDIQQMEYIEGFTEDDITDYKYSFNTTRAYTNYYLEFPTDYLKLKISGNYILKVFNETPEEENVIFTRRFMVVEQLVDIQAKVVNTTNLDERYTRQQIDFSILPGNYIISNPYQDLRVVITQNGRWDNAIMNIQPRMIIANELDFSQDPKIVFDAGNEYRYFDMKTLRYTTERMQAIQYDNEGLQVYLLDDQVRLNKEYRSDEDIDGKRLIAANQVRDAYTEGDYAWVHFFLYYKIPMIEGNFYVAGALTDWALGPEGKMTYNFQRQGYEAKIFLKQGYYNYEYIFLEDGKTIGEVALAEGNFWETENGYTIYVYHKQQGFYYDRLIGISFVNSRKGKQ
jgi:hypothetical protein